MTVRARTSKPDFWIVSEGLPLGLGRLAAANGGVVMTVRARTSKPGQNSRLARSENRPRLPPAAIQLGRLEL